MAYAHEIANISNGSHLFAHLLEYGLPAAIALAAVWAYRKLR